MQFNENGENFIVLPKYKNNFIYFLLQGNDVVYVGQTTHGILRPLTHKDKKFDDIVIMYCNPEELDYYEDKFIVKYKPIYNKQINYKYNYTLKMVKGLIRKNTYIKDFNLWDLKKIIPILGIKISNIYNVQTISFSDYEKIYNYIMRGKYGR